MDIPFTYGAFWNAPGRWGIEIMSKKNRYILKPMEKLSKIPIGSVQQSPIELNDTFDLSFKPGLYRQVETFLSSPINSNLCTLSEQIEAFPVYNEIGVIPMINFTSICITPNHSIVEALSVIEGGSAQIALVLNSSGVLVGTLSDGDIRRSLLSGIGLNETVEKAMNTNFVYATEQNDEAHIRSLMKQYVLRQIPVLESVWSCAGSQASRGK